ncbi:PspC domain-containing protein [Saccharopolyspora phatthalungensis]|uniref:Phage shock protein PspC (Stress-responsive transcriptional regulator) n=1 Tax=Saccharopolyspora phatthalungensis TaxID=664693 RepID=A0A840Q0K1_9PSEU|nr:PspC domain-containing protein [Saccharopolyspora phatthalungensis]MBB5153864.1 phage shock protein PspC (stress-responsive transcriptional regulator) [Saccharopolyspora phatthalungensis]
MTENFSSIDSAQTTDTGTTERQVRRFRRDRDDAMIAGLCSGAAKTLGVDATIIRVLLVAATLLGFGMGIVIYLVCWLIVPQE